MAGTARDKEWPGQVLSEALRAAGRVATECWSSDTRSQKHACRHAHVRTRMQTCTCSAQTCTLTGATHVCIVLIRACKHTHTCMLTLVLLCALKHTIHTCTCAHMLTHMHTMCA